MSWSRRVLHASPRPWWQAALALAALSAGGFLVTASVASAAWAVGIGAAIGLAGLALNAVTLVLGRGREQRTDDPPDGGTGSPAPSRIYLNMADETMDRVARRIARAVRQGGVESPNGADSEAEAWHFTVELPSGSVEAVLTGNWREARAPERLSDPRYYYDWRLAYQLAGPVESDPDERELRYQAAGAELARRLEEGLDRPAMHLDGRSRILRMYRPDRGPREFSTEQVYPDTAHRDSWGPWVVRRHWEAAG